MAEYKEGIMSNIHIDEYGKKHLVEHLLGSGVPQEEIVKILVN